MKTMVELYGRAKCSVLFVLGVLYELQEHGWITMTCEEDPDAKPLLPKGVAAFDQLQAEGFAPSQQEIAGALLSFGRANPLFADDEFLLYTLKTIKNWGHIRNTFFEETKEE